MRGEEKKQSELFHYFSVEQCVPAEHPLRSLRLWCDAALAKLSNCFEAMYSDTGRPSIAPEALLKSQVLMALYSVRSDRLFCEMLGYNILFRWFLGMSLNEPVFNHSVFSHNRERLIEHQIGREFLLAMVELARERELLSDEHFTVDGTLIESWASLKSFKPKDEPPSQPPGDTSRNPTIDFHGEKRSNETHCSSTDPEARLAKKGKGKEAKLCFTGHAITENRNGLVVEAELTQSNGEAERDTAIVLVDRLLEQNVPVKSLGADKGYYATETVAQLRDPEIKPHIPPKQNCSIPGIDRRTTESPGFKLSQIKRKLVEEAFGFMKTVAGLRKSRFCGVARNAYAFSFAMAVYDLVRIANLCGPP